MLLSRPSVALFVRDIQTSKDFYRNLLQLRIELDFGKNVIFESGLALWEIQRSHIIPRKLGLKKISDESVNRFELYFETEDLPGIENTLREKHVVFLHEMHEEPWGQNTIRFFDPDHHLIEVGESMQQFVHRIYNQGFSVEQVSEKTHVPVEEVKRLIGL
jgi:catechol 2,3-dioxygenase-like lactoylglutathione lyase family enzyme